tara:strand:- start:80 stop:277 length:198 start_codon:yes stop_codon:yes gene_type:complete
MKMRKTLCTVKLFFGNHNMDVDIYLDLDGSIEDQVFDIYGDKITDFKWQEKTLSAMIKDLTALRQ